MRSSDIQLTIIWWINQYTVKLRLSNRYFHGILTQVSLLTPALPIYLMQISFPQIYPSKRVLPSGPLRPNLPGQRPPSQRQRRHIQQRSRLLQRQSLLHLDRLNLPLSYKRRRLPLNHRLHLCSLDRIFPLFNLAKPLSASIRTSLANCLPGNKLLLTILANLDNSQITTHKGLFSFNSSVSNRIIPYQIVPYCIIAYQFPTPITGKPLKICIVLELVPKRTANKGKRKPKRTIENPWFPEAKESTASTAQSPIASRT